MTFSKNKQNKHFITNYKLGARINVCPVLESGDLRGSVRCELRPEEYHSYEHNFITGNIVTLERGEDTPQTGNCSNYASLLSNTNTTNIYSHLNNSSNIHMKIN